jgi:hypothetical protein
MRPHDFIFIKREGTPQEISGPAGVAVFTTNNTPAVMIIKMHGPDPAYQVFHLWHINTLNNGQLGLLFYWGNDGQNQTVMPPRKTLTQALVEAADLILRDRPQTLEIAHGLRVAGETEDMGSNLVAARGEFSNSTRLSFRKKIKALAGWKSE